MFPLIYVPFFVKIFAVLPDSALPAIRDPGCSHWKSPPLKIPNGNTILIWEQYRNNWMDGDAGPVTP
jgi:hypothetical protein